MSRRVSMRPSSSFLAQKQVELTVHLPPALKDPAFVSRTYWWIFNPAHHHHHFLLYTVKSSWLRVFCSHTHFTPSNWVSPGWKSRFEKKNVSKRWWTFRKFLHRMKTAGRETLTIRKRLMKMKPMMLSDGWNYSIHPRARCERKQTLHVGINVFLFRLIVHSPAASSTPEFSRPVVKVSLAFVQLCLHKSWALTL